MWDILCRVLVAFFWLVGLMELCRTCLFWLFGPHEPGRIVVFLRLEGHVEDVEYRLRAALEKLRWIRGRIKRKLSVWTTAWMRRPGKFV